MEQLEPVDMRTATKCLEILPEGIAVETPEGARETIEADNVVVAVGLRPRWEETDALRPLVRDFVAIGDCLRVGKIGTAVRAGYDAAMDL
jgi:2,4-dienoyl-CoA reductase (NADPH2)